MKKYSYVFVVLISFLVIGALGNYLYHMNDKKVRDAKIELQETTIPEQISTVEEKNLNDRLPQTNLISVTDPLPYATATNPLSITGVARGYWYFEATFPVELIDGTGKQITSGHATALTDWMTEDFVPFQSELSWATTTATSGILRLHKNNPSELPEHDAFIDIPLVFEK